jgi:hypothetical protein
MNILWSHGFEDNFSLWKWVPTSFGCDSTYTALGIHAVAAQKLVDSLSCKRPFNYIDILCKSVKRIKY